jgi:hypothetical protein
VPPLGNVFSERSWFSGDQRENKLGALETANVQMGTRAVRE